MLVVVGVEITMQELLELEVMEAVEMVKHKVVQPQQREQQTQVAAVVVEEILLTEAQQAALES